MDKTELAKQRRALRMLPWNQGLSDDVLDWMIIRQIVARTAAEHLRETLSPFYHTKREWPSHDDGFWTEWRLEELTRLDKDIGGEA